MRESRAREFESLRQGPRMTVAEYDVRFSELFRYTLWLVDTEERRTSRFVRGLANYLFCAIVSQRYMSYVDAVDCTMMM